MEIFYKVEKGDNFLIRNLSWLPFSKQMSNIANGNPLSACFFGLGLVVLAIYLITWKGDGE